MEPLVWPLPYAVGQCCMSAYVFVALVIRIITQMIGKS
jgi:hypothetical protein